MFSAKKSAIQLSRPYAVAADFCRIFESDMDRLYLLAYLLTADKAMAEECFVRGLEDSTRSNRVFRDWAESWARRTVIHNAIQMVRPRPSDASARPSQANDAPAPIAAVLGLPAFERFVFVMSMLEHHSLQESSLLLGCSREEVTVARSRALQQLERTAEPIHEAERISVVEPASGRERGAALAMAAVHLAASA